MPPVKILATYPLPMIRSIELMGEFHCICRMFLRSLDLLMPCEHPDPPTHRVVSWPERRNRAKVPLQIPISECQACHYAEDFAARSKPTVRDHHLRVLNQRKTCLACHTEHRGTLAEITTGVLPVSKTPSLEHE